MELRPDLVTVEISLNGTSGIELIKTIRGFDPSIGILVVSFCDELVYASRALKAGASGFVNKCDQAEDVLRAIRRLLDGGLCFSGTVENQMLTTLRRGDRTPGSGISSLTDREIEIGNLIGGGMVTRLIAQRLHVSVKTIETHRSHIKKKLGLLNSSELLRFWVQWADAQSNNMPKRPDAPSQSIERAGDQGQLWKAEPT
jgi:DNA-binding NarL/FixJ family response regulator